MGDQRSTTFTRGLWLFLVALILLLASLGPVPLGRVGFTERISIGDLVYSALIGAIFGAVLGTIQWLVVRRSWYLSHYWILYTSLGLCLAWIFWYFTGYFVTLLFGHQEMVLGPLATYVSGVIAAALLAGAQWLSVARDQGDARKWAAYTFVSWFIAWIIPMVSYQKLWGYFNVDLHGWRYDLFVGLAFGLIYGAITALALPIQSIQE